MGINKIPSSSVALTRRLGGLGGLIGSQRLPASRDTLAPRSPTVLSSCESPLSSSTQHFESRLIVLAHTAVCCSHDVTVMCPSCHSVRREWKKFCCRSRRPFSQSGDRVCGLKSETLWHFKRWFVLWWAHVFMWLCLLWADPNKQMRDKLLSGVLHTNKHRNDAGSHYLAREQQIRWIYMSERALGHVNIIQSLNLLLSVVYTFIIVLVW